MRCGKVTTTILLQFDKYCRISEQVRCGGARLVIITGGGSQSTGGRHREAQSIHLDRTSKSSNSSLGSRDWSGSRDRLIGSYCCCRGSGSYPECLALTTLSHYDPHKATATTCLCSANPSFPFNGRVYFYIASCKCVRITEHVHCFNLEFTLWRSSIRRGGFWKVSPLCYGYDACLTFPQTWSITDRASGALAWMSALRS